MNNEQINKQNEKVGLVWQNSTQNEFKNNKKVIKPHKVGLTTDFVTNYFEFAMKNPVFEYLYNFLDIYRKKESYLKLEDRLFFNLNRIAKKYNLSTEDFDMLCNDFCFIPDMVLNIVSKSPNITITITKNKR